jgi:HD-like signal output (HDOD) protein/nitrogen-specific signal transduction histidine kinase
VPKPPENSPCSGRFAQLPTPPAVLIQLIDSCNDPHVSFEELAAIVQQDPAITAKVIAAANSPYYRQWQEITDLNRLLVVLGTKTVRTIALNSAVQLFFNQLDKSAGRAIDRIWYYSLVCAHCAKSLAELITYPSPDEAYLSGLLHRLGQLALLQTYPEKYSALLDEGLNGEALAQVERTHVGYASAAVGAELIDSWQLHTFISDAVLYQHEPANAILDSSHLVKLINLASDLARLEQTTDSRVLERADLLFGLNQSTLENLLQESREKTIATARSLNIALPHEKEDKEAEHHLKALGERIRQAALFGGGIDSMPEKSDLPMTLQQIQRDFDLLFSLDRTCFLLLNSEKKQLQPIDPVRPEDPLLNDLTFSTEGTRSLASKAFLEQRIYSNEDDMEIEPSVADRQIARYMQRQVLTYLPLTSQQQPLGLIAVGSHPAEWATLDGQRELLALFASEAAQTLLRQREMQQQQAQIIDEERAAFQLESRKVVHEANNPLGIINNYLHILGMKLGEDHPVQEELNIIREEIDRVGKIILRIRDIPADVEQLQRTVDINQLIEDLDRLFQSSLFPSQQISSTLDLDRSIREIRTQRSHIKQVLTNLMKNAVEAMEQGGNITITTRDNAFLNGEAYIEIQVIDDGPGIPAEIMQQLFTPVASTKGSTHSGLGLAIVKNLMDELSGHISCTSNAGQGTRFQLYLPRTGKSNQA